MKPTNADFLPHSGGDNNLAVIMSAYQPPSAIQCSGKFRAMSSCQDVLEGMPVTTEKEAFGPPTDRTTQVLLPQAVESCEMINGPPCVLVFFSDISSNR